MAGAMFGNQAMGGSFGGMGFMPPSTQDGLAGVLNTATQSAPLGESRTSKSSIIPLTFKMFWNAMKEQGGDAGPDGRRKIHGREISSVTFVAQVMQVQEQNSFWIFSMDDNTASADVKYWIDTEDRVTVERLRTTMQRGKYLRVVASIRTYKDEIVITAHHLAPVDGVEIAAHLIECLYTKKKLLMPKPEKTAQPQQTNQQFHPQNMGGGNFGAPQQQQEQHQAQQQQFPGQPMVHQNSPGQNGFQYNANAFGQQQQPQQAPQQAFGGAPAPQQYGGAPQQVSQQFGGAPQQAPQQFGGAPQQVPQQFGGAPQQVPQQFGGAPQQAFQQFGNAPQNSHGGGQPHGRAHPYAGAPRIRPEELVQVFLQFQGNSEHGLHRDQAFHYLQQKYPGTTVDEFNALLESCVNDEGTVHETNEHYFKTA